MDQTENISIPSNTRRNVHFPPGSIDEKLTETVEGIIEKYGNSSERDSGSRIMDNVQHFAECCGINGPADWLENSIVQTMNLTVPDVLPCSCFRYSKPSVNSSWCSESRSFSELWIGHGNGTFNQSCSQKITDWLQGNFLTIIAMDVILILLQIIELSIAGSLFREFGKKEEKRTSKITQQLVDEDHARLGSSSDGADPDSGEQNYAFIDPDEGTTHPNYITAGDASVMAYDHQNQNWNQNQGYQEPLYDHQNQGYHGYQEGVQHY